MATSAHTRLTPQSFAGFSATMFAVGMISVGFGAVDMAMIAPFGTEVLAAVGLAEVVVVTLTAFLAGPIDAFTSRFAQAEGGGRTHREFGASITSFLLLCLVLEAAAIVFALSSAGLLTALGQNPQMAEAASAYIQVRLGGVILTILFLVGMETLRILGLRSFSVLVLGTALAANAGLNAIVLYSPIAEFLGPVTGVAVTTIVVHGAATLVAVMSVLAVFHRRDTVVERPTQKAVLERFVQMLRTGMGIGVRHLNDHAAATVPFLLIGTMGVRAIAAAAVATKIWTLYCRVPQACMSASFVFYGYMLGRGGPRGAIRRSLLLYTAGPTLLSAVLVMVGAPWLVWLLGGGSVDIADGVLLTAAFMVGVVPYLFEKLAGELLTVEGEAGYLALTTTIATYGLSIPLAAIAVFAAESAFFALAAGTLASSVLAALFWKRLGSLQRAEPVSTAGGA